MRYRLLLVVSWLSFFFLHCSPSPSSSLSESLGFHEQPSLTGPEFKGKKLFRAWAANNLGDPDYMLAEGRFDVGHMHHIFKGAWGGSYYPQLLIGEQEATRTRVFQLLGQAQAELTEKDMYIQYSSSHGVDRGLILYPEPNQPDLLTYEALRDEILKIKAREVVVFLMSCYSGRLIEAFNLLDQSQLKKQWEGRTLFVMTSSTKEQKSRSGPMTDEQEPIQIQGSAGSRFGHFLWKALSGEADQLGTGNQDGNVTLGEITTYVTENVKPKHDPQVYGFFDPELVMTRDVAPLPQIQANVLKDELERLSSRYQTIKSTIEKLNQSTRALYEKRRAITNEVQSGIYNSVFGKWFNQLDSLLVELWEQQWQLYDEYEQLALEWKCDLGELQYPNTSSAFDRMAWATECDEYAQQQLQKTINRYNVLEVQIQIILDVEILLIKLLAPNYESAVKRIQDEVNENNQQVRALYQERNALSTELYTIGIKLLEERTQPGAFAETQALASSDGSTNTVSESDSPETDSPETDNEKSNRTIEKNTMMGNRHRRSRPRETLNQTHGHSHSQ